MVQPLTFQLFERTVQRGVLEGQGAITVTPTAAGKPFIELNVVRAA
jgi:hypothetical protein